MRHVRHTAAVLATAAVLLGGCTDAATAELPPVDASALVSGYDEELAQLGWQLTERGGLVDADTYETDPRGTHLSLYVAPTGAPDDQDYIDGLLSVTALFAGDVFARWPALESFDVCQEAAAAGDDGDTTAAARTQLTLTRTAAESADWDVATLQDVADVVNGSAESSLVLLDEALRDRFREALGSG